MGHGIIARVLWRLCSGANLTDCNHGPKSDLPIICIRNQENSVAGCGAAHL